MQLDPELAEETMEEVRRRDPEPALVEVSERYHFSRLWMRHRLAGGDPPSDNLLWQKNICHEALQLCLPHR